MKLAVLALLALAAAVRAEAAADPARYLKADLISETAGPRPGSTILIGIRMSPQPGWHGYWSNPGDSGIAPSGTWSAPAGITFGSLLHPAPSLMVADDMTSFIHAGPHVLLAKMQVPATVRRGARLPIVAKLRWAACTPTKCVPLKATLRLDLVAGSGKPGPDADLIRAVAAKLPGPAPNGTYVRDGKAVRLSLPASLRLDWRKTAFFPDDSAPLDIAKGRASLRHGRVTLKLPVRSGPPSTMTGVVSDGRHAYRIGFHQIAH